jgi:hypothetical protein
MMNMSKQIIGFIAGLADIIANDGMTEYGNRLSREYCLEALEAWLLLDAGQVTIEDILDCMKV